MRDQDGIAMAEDRNGRRIAARLPGPYQQRAAWLDGEVRRHCASCEAEVGREDRACLTCSAPLRKECPRCHYWAEMDVTFCVSCRYAFPLPVSEKAVIKMWHPGGRGPV